MNWNFEWENIVITTVSSSPQAPRSVIIFHVENRPSIGKYAERVSTVDEEAELAIRQKRFHRNERAFLFISWEAIRENLGKGNCQKSLLWESLS